jgi:hypothetical protein
MHSFVCGFALLLFFGVVVREDTNNKTNCQSRERSVGFQEERRELERERERARIVLWCPWRLLGGRPVVGM